jgi:biotin transport system ATP-binding protein
VIVVTHDLDKILAHADRLILVDEGTVAADGKPEDVISLASRCGVRIPRGFSKESIGEMTWLKD